MDILSIIKSEHREVCALIDQIEPTEPGDERLREIAGQIVEKLQLHMALEERLFYPELRTRSEDDEQRVDVFEAYTEHAVAKALVEMLQSGRKPDEKFKAELQVLGESVKHHIQEEESTVFTIANDVLESDELDELGASWERSKTRAQNSASRKGGSRKKTTAKKSARKKSTQKKTTRKKTRR